MSESRRSGVFAHRSVGLSITDERITQIWCVRSSLGALAVMRQFGHASSIRTSGGTCAHAGAILAG